MILNKKRGQATVEFVLLLPVIIFFIVIIIEFGMIISTYIRISNISREVARGISVGRMYISDNLKEDPAVDYLSAGLDMDRVTIESTQFSENEIEEVRVKVTYEYIPLTGIISSSAFPNSLESRVVMMME